MKDPFDEQDQGQIRELGIPLAEAKRQLEVFKKGVPHLRIDRPCIPGDGIRIFKTEERERFARNFEQEISKGRVLKFVPASGAASRMFRDLLSFYSSPKSPQVKIPNSVGEFFTNLDRFPFYPEMKTLFEKQDKDIKVLLRNKDFDSILSVLFSREDLDLAHRPKGLVPFHRYGEVLRSAFEEHLVEAIHYACDRNKLCRIHFTVGSAYLEKIQSHLMKAASAYEYSGILFDLSFSIQKKSTQTLSVDSSFRPIRSEDGRLLFRPGGHGSLISNLDECQGDLVFIKNIDNVTVDSKREDTYNYKKALGGYLVELQNQIFEYLRHLERGNFSESQLEVAMSFASSELGLSGLSPEVNQNPEEKKKFLFQALNRPIRVCGMVPNRGEAGGGPFWVRHPERGLTRQIVESVQVDTTDPVQGGAFRASTHFNPVDLVCGVKDFRGKNFDLKKFVDPETGFISQKSQGGRDVSALEHPGLWNGGMAHWITLFVEVPLTTFAPVKTVNDLLRPEHQS